MQFACCSVHVPPYDSIGPLVRKTCSKSLENVYPLGIIKNYQHAMDYVEITIMRCSPHPIMTSLHFLFHEFSLSPLHQYHPSRSNTNHVRIYTNDFCIMYSFIDSTHIYDGRGGGAGCCIRLILQKGFFFTASKMKAKIALFQLISGVGESYWMQVVVFLIRG